MALELVVLPAALRDSGVFRRLSQWAKGKDLTPLSRFKWPKRYEFVEALPKNNYGKVLKTVLRNLDAQ